MKMGTVEPRYNDENVKLTLLNGNIQDNALAFIYGAIKNMVNIQNYLVN